MRPFRMPEILLLVSTEDCSVMRDEVRHVEKLIAVLLDNCPGNDVDVQLFGEGTVCIEVFLVLRTVYREGRVIWDPAC